MTRGNKTHDNDGHQSNSQEQRDELQDEPSFVLPSSGGAITTTNKTTKTPTTHTKDHVRPPHPYTNASLFSQVFFLWPYSLLKLGMQRPLTDQDLADVLPPDQSEVNMNHLLHLWNQEVSKHSRNDHHNSDHPDLKRVFFKDFFRSLWFIQPFIGAALLAKIIQAVCLGNLIQFFEDNNVDDSDINPNEGYLWAMGLVLCGCVVLFEHHHVFFIAWRKGMQFRIASVAAIYDKSLKLSSTHQETLAHYGRILNLASNDVERFMFSTLFVSYLWWAPLQAIGILVTGTVLVGWSFSVGVALLAVFFFPLQTWLSRSFAKFRSTIAAITDQRVNFVSQAVRGARVMKLSGYETKFLDRIQKYRALEVAQLKKASRLKAANEALFFVANVVVSFAVFLVHVLSGNTLTTGDVFLVFTLVNILQLELIKHVSIGVMASSELSVSIQRVQDFLEFPELDMGDDQQAKDLKSIPPPVVGEVAIAMKNVFCKWNHVRQVGTPRLAELRAEKNKVDFDGMETSSSGSETSSMALQDVSLEFSHGTLTTLIGPVGGGKSALIQALVRELTVTSGTIERNYRTLAYTAQDTWIMDGTIIENITMGMEFDQEWYTQVLKACCLTFDFAQLRDGDRTVVGDRGVQLSGGQKARVGLARALYKDADVLVADDPLSAVDARVGRHLFQQAIMGLSVKRGKCVILATHQHQYIHDERCILVMNGGQVKCVGSYEECVNAADGKLTAHDADTTEEDENDTSGKSNTGKQVGLSTADIEIEDVNGDVVVKSKKQDSGKNESEQAERQNQGLLTRDTYINYIKAFGGLWVGLFLLILFIGTQTSVLVTVATMGRWAEREDSDQDNVDIIATVGGMTALVVLLAVFRAFICFELTIKASQELHDRMAASVLRAKIEFFDTNPLGRVLNRFSADCGICDDQLPQTIFDFATILFIVFGAIITALSTLPFALAILPFLIWYFTRVRSVFVTSTRELKRLEGLARSPIFARLSEALGGIATIRANDYLGYFRKKFFDAHDAHTRTFFAFIGASRWVGFRMDSIVFMFMSAVSFFAVVVQNEGWFEVDPAILGLSISMLVYLSGVFQWCIRQSAEMVNQMVSVERVLEYGKLESEASLECDGDDQLLTMGWPATGEIAYDGVSVRYRSTLPLALRKISFRIPAGARVGVVGRTGSGKSTVVQSLFRLLEAEDGKILIDGEDISKLGLHTVRTKISVIPQVPTLFSGCTIRENLDLFELHSDDEILKVLNSCHLKEAIDELPDGWNSIVSEGGSNFSVGQRQLLCLARALLSQNKILVLDEATASVDRRTDQLLQHALQESYQGGTILAVAHRLDTIINYDFILVLGAGEVLEFGSPAELISNESGIFAQMVNDTGEAMSNFLKETVRLSQPEKEKTS